MQAYEMPSKCFVCGKYKRKKCGECNVRRIWRKIPCPKQPSQS